MTADVAAARYCRHWANGSEPSLFELIADSYGALVPTRSFLRIRPVVVDADVLLKEMVAEVKRPGEVVLYAASRLGLLRIYVAETVPGEVDRNLQRVCAETRRDYVAARAVWAEWRPHLRVVATPAVIPAEVAMVMPSDAPTAVLALALGRPLSWSNDQDLQRTGFALRYPLESALAARDVGQTEMSVHVSLRISSATLEELAKLVRRGWVAAGPNGRLAILSALGLVLGVGIARRQQIAAKLNASVPHVLSALSQGFERVREWYGAELRKLPPAPALEAGLPVTYLIARVLAYAPLPMTAPEIVTRLAAHEITVTPEEVREVLASTSMFVLVGRWYWQLGL